MDWLAYFPLGVFVALGAWGLLFGIALWRSRPELPQVGEPAGGLPGEEPPAVVSMLANRWLLTDDSIDSTLLDLAARGFLELRQPGDDPAETTARLRKGDGRSLTPYEQQILDRVRRLAVSGVTPLNSLAFGSWAEARRWRSTFYRAVVDDARERGLSQLRLSRSQRRGFLVGALAPAVFAAVSWFGVDMSLKARLTDQVLGGLLAGAGVFLLQYFVLDFTWGDRDTPAGQAAATRWLALREHLLDTEGVADLAPADIASWGREMSYASAFGLLSTDEALVKLRPEPRLRVFPPS